MARIAPLTPSIDLTTRQSTFAFRSRLRNAASYVFAVDFYSHLRESHPETHLGYWVFALPEGDAETTIGLDFRTINQRSVWKETSAGRVEAIDSWWNPAYVLDPIVGIQLVLRNASGRVIENRFIAGKVKDTKVLTAHYHRVHAVGGYTPTEPFLFELHAAMLARLERLFLAHIPRGGLVLDAGCGRSLFTEIRPEWPFQILAGDVDLDLIKSRQTEFPKLGWLVSDAQPLPIRNEAVDALFAGELIEHLRDPHLAIAEFHRVLKPGGVLILTTPNRLRLANVADGSERPYSPDHLSELSYDEVLRVLRDQGFKILHVTGVHLELLLNWFSSLPKLDRLQRGWNRPWAIPLMKLLLAAGALWPRYSLDLIVVARKHP